MTATAGAQEREVVPRWRTLARTTATGELEALEAPDPARRAPPDATLTDKRAEFAANYTESFAAELAGAALVVDAPAEAREAAEFLLRLGSVATPASRALARRVLAGADPARPHPGPADGAQDPKDHVRSLRTRLRGDPRNAVAWAELARLHASDGLARSAERSMTTALALAPDNRFLLRSGACFYAHRAAADRAHHLLERAPPTPSDPWLVSAELAAAALAGRRPRFAKAGLRMLEAGRLGPHHLTELASALATMELRAGSDKRARRLFRRALESPTENSLAQVEWASHRLAGLDLEPQLLEVPGASEARSRHWWEGGEWAKAAAEAWEWHHDQPFAIEAAVAGSYVTSTGLQDHAQAIAFARTGLRVLPGDPMLRNNLAFSLLETKQVSEARALIDRLRTEPLGGHERVAALATDGLLAFRSNDVERGRTLYRAAMAAAKGPDLADIHALAAVMLAREEIATGTPEAPGALAAARNLAKSSRNAAVEVWLRRVEADAETGLARAQRSHRG